MADLKSLLGDKYQEGMTVEEIMSLNVEVPEPDMTGFISKEHFDRVASEAANYKKQLRANMSEAEAKAKDEADRYAALEEELKQLKADKAIAENAKGLVAIGYDDALATEVATALYNGESATVIKAIGKFVETQRKAVLAEAVKDTPVPPTSGESDTAMTKEKLKTMSPAERYEFSQKNPEEYKRIYGGN